MLGLGTEHPLEEASVTAVASEHRWCVRQLPPIAHAPDGTLAPLAQSPVDAAALGERLHREPAGIGLAELREQVVARRLDVPARSIEAGPELEVLLENL